MSIENCIEFLDHHHSPPPFELEKWGFKPLKIGSSCKCFIFPDKAWVIKIQSPSKLHRRYKLAKKVGAAIRKHQLEPLFTLPKQRLYPLKGPPLFLIEQKVNSKGKKALISILKSSKIHVYLRGLKKIIEETGLSDVRPSNVFINTQWQWVFIDTGNQDPRPIEDFTHQLKVHYLCLLKDKEKKRLWRIVQQIFYHAKGWERS